MVSELSWEGPAVLEMLGLNLELSACEAWVLPLSSHPFNLAWPFSTTVQSIGELRMGYKCAMGRVIY